MAANALLRQLQSPAQTAQRPAELRLQPARQQRPVLARAEAATKEAPKKDDKKPKEEEKGPFQPPTLDATWPAPIFGGSTGGLLRKAQVRPSDRQSAFVCRAW